MPAPGTLFGEATQALEGASQTAISQNQIAQKDRGDTIQAGESAGAGNNAASREQSAQQAAQKMEQMKTEAMLKGEMITITPQLALGLVKNTGEKDWLQSVGQSMRADVYTGLYTHGMALANAKKAPKITQINDANGKIRHAVVYTDEEGNQQQLMLDAGMTPEQLHPDRSKGKGATDPNFKKNQQFIKSYESARKELSDPIRAKELEKLNPDDYREKTQWLKDNQDQYDQLIKGMGKAGAPEPAKSPSAGSQSPGGAPFDADSFIKDALGN